MNWKITYFDEKVFEQIMNLPEPLRVRYTTLIDRMCEIGPNLGMPHTEYISAGLCEIRVKASTGIARVFYCTVVNQTIVILHSFIKKTDKIPQKELAIAYKRMKEIKNGKK